MKDVLKERLIAMLNAVLEARPETTKAALAEQMGLSPQAFGNNFNPKRPAPEKFVEDFINKFGLSKRFYETGQGTPYTNSVYMLNEEAATYNRSKPKMQTTSTLIKQNIPMYNLPASASMVKMYGDDADVKIVGYLNIPGAAINSFALPVHGHSMYPTLENGSWGVVRPINDINDIDWGQIYYIEYGDYRVWKRLIKADEEPDSVILFSDNISEKVGERLKYASKTIKTERITKLCLLTDILKKPNY
ncbi:MAG TPA: S24 family peptidase [Mucilaginibacter sp.]